MNASTAELLTTIVPLILIIVVFYFMLIRPQQKRQKKIKEMLDNLKVGDRVKTIGGIYGRIVSIKDDNYITIEVGTDRVKLVFDRSAISTVEDVEAENVMPN